MKGGRITMTFEQFLKINDLTEESIIKIVKECSRYNDKLKTFLKSKRYKDVPASFLEELFQIYNSSTINIKTGEIIMAPQRLEDLTFFRTDKVELSLYSLRKEGKKAVLPNILLITLDENGKFLDYCNFGMGTRGIDLKKQTKMSSILASSIFKKKTSEAEQELCDIELDKLGEAAEIMVYVQNREGSSEANPFQDVVLDISLFEQGFEYFTTDFSVEKIMNNFRSCLALRIYKQVNEWQVEKICSPTTKNTTDIIKEYTRRGYYHI
jgi:hypothetical protein